MTYHYILGFAALLGLAIYYGFCLRQRLWLPPIEKVIEALTFGAGVPAGVHLVCGAFEQHLLCHAPEPDFREHIPEIVVGGVALFVGSIHSLTSICKRPAHHHSLPHREHHD
jgi:hypothetical protein